MHLSGTFSTEQELQEKLDFIYQKSSQGRNFHGIIEVAFNEVTIMTAVHNIKANRGAQTSGIDGKEISEYLQMNKHELVRTIQNSVIKYQPKPARRVYIPKANGKLRPLGIPSALDKIIQECLRIVIEPITEAKYFPHSYGFRPYRSCRHAVKEVLNKVNHYGECKPYFAIEGDIKGYFDNINHRKLLRKLWEIGVHDKRVISIIRAMLKAGYMESDIYNRTNTGTPQGGIISPLLANIYLNSFDWYIARMYQLPPNTPSNIQNKRKAMRKQGIHPKHLIRYADDWLILTTSRREAERLVRKLEKYFKHRMSLELSKEKTAITDIRQAPIKFLGFCIKAEPKHGSSSKSLTAKGYPNPEKVSGQIKNICSEIRKLRQFNNNGQRAAQVGKINQIITGIAEYWKTSICSIVFKRIDNAVYHCAHNTFFRIYGNKSKECFIRLSESGNQEKRHSGYQSRTFAVKYDDKWIAITKASLTHSAWKHNKIFNQKMTPYTPEGRALYEIYSKKKLPLPRTNINDVTLPQDANIRLYNVEYFLNMGYAYNQDKGRCRCCGKVLVKGDRHCHHINEGLPTGEVNKVPNLAWVCYDCHELIHGNTLPEKLNKKTRKKILKFQQSVDILFCSPR